jgi:hypothetical protein
MRNRSMGHRSHGGSGKINEPLNRARNDNGILPGEAYSVRVEGNHFIKSQRIASWQRN